MDMSILVPLVLGASLIASEGAFAFLVWFETRSVRRMFAKNEPIEKELWKDRC